LSLKSTGKVKEAAELLHGFSSYYDVADDSKDVQDAFNIVKQSLEGLTEVETLNRINELDLSSGVSKELMEAAKSGNLLKSSTDEINKGIKNFQNTSSIVDDFSSTFTGLESSVKSGL